MLKYQAQVIVSRSRTNQTTIMFITNSYVPLKTIMCKLKMFQQVLQKVLFLFMFTFYWCSFLFLLNFD